MGYFTWTLANRKLVKTAHGDYAARCVLRYNGYGAIVCPDNTLIKEYCYEGYGIFDGKDVYDLVVDWNKPFLKDIIRVPGLASKDITFGSAHMDVMRAFADDDQEKLNDCIDKVAAIAPYMRKDWKRNIGIFIACGSNNNIIPYPIKIVDCKYYCRPYADLPPSISTQ